MKVYPNKALELNTLHFINLFIRHTIKPRRIKYADCSQTYLDEDLNRFFTLFKKSEIYIVDRLPTKLYDYDFDEVENIEFDKSQFVLRAGNQNNFENYKPEDETILDTVNKFRLDELVRVEVKSFSNTTNCQGELEEKELNIIGDLEKLNAVSDNENIKNLTLVTSIYYSYFFNSIPNEFQKNRRPYSELTEIRELLKSQFAVFRIWKLMTDFFHRYNILSPFERLENMYVIEEILKKQPFHIRWGLNLAKSNTVSTYRAFASILSKKNISKEFIGVWYSTNKALEKHDPIEDSPDQILINIINKELEK